MAALAPRAENERAASFLAFPYLRRLTRVAAWVAVTVCVTGFAITREPLFAAVFALAAAIDLGSMWAIVGRAEASQGLDEVAGAHRMPLLVGTRFVLKALLMLVAAFVFGMPALLGAVLGVLVVDTTFLVAGPVVAAHSVFAIERRPRE